jgi:hypothetical protein
MGLLLLLVMLLLGLLIFVLCSPCLQLLLP